MEYYLSYGSNLNIKEMKSRCKNAKLVTSFYLEGYELYFNKYLTIIPSKNGIVPIGVWEINREDEKKLDIYEGYPSLYRKEYIDFSLNGKKEKALIYIMNDISKSIFPTEEYLNICFIGYKSFNFDKKYIENALKKMKKE